MKKLLIIMLALLTSLALYSENMNKTEIAGVELEWIIENEDLLVTLSAETDGWIAVGFDPENKMKGANIIIGYVTEQGEVILEDHYGNTQISHKSDISSGGSTDLEIIEGSESGGRTTITFTIPLNSGDDYDKALLPDSSIKVIAAYGNRDNVTTKHRNRGTGFITL